MFISVGTALLWWKFYEENEKLKQLHDAFNQTFNETGKISSESFNKTSETFNQTLYQTNKTVSETMGESFNETDELLSVSAISESVFLAPSILASLVTVRCYLCSYA